MLGDGELKVARPLCRWCEITSWVSGSRSTWGSVAVADVGDDVDHLEHLDVAFEAEVPGEPGLQAHVLEHCWCRGVDGEGEGP